MKWKKKCMAGIFAGLSAFAGSVFAHPVQPADTTRVVTDPAKRAIVQEDTSHRQALLEKMEAAKARFREESDGAVAMKRLSVKSIDEGGTLLFSDSPEYVSQNGILYRDTVSGDARVLYYHLNDTDQPKKVEVVVEGKLGINTTVTITRSGVGAPSDDYMKVGKEAQSNYFNDSNHLNTRVYLLNGRAHVLDFNMDHTILEPGQLVHGIYDFHADHPVTVTVLMCDAGDDPVVAAHTERVLPKDAQRLRGTFPLMNRIISTDRPYDPMRDGTVYIPLADDVHDLYRRGIDATDGSTVTNYGNYGIVYFMDIPTTGHLPVSYFLSPLGGTFAGAMTAATGTGKGQKQHLLEVPAQEPYFGDATPPETEKERVDREKNGQSVIKNTTELADLGTYKTSDEVRFEFSPPGASNLPVNLILSPEK